MKSWRMRLISVLAGCTFLFATTYSQQVADPAFDARVTRPTYTKSHPRILFDEAHNNFHTTTGRYKPFVDLITNDGYSVTPNKEALQKKTLASYDILIIANALGAARQNLPDAGKAAFRDDECDIVRDWVSAGGSLLLIADHAPFGSAAEIMARRFGVDMSKGHTSDSVNFDPETHNLRFLLYSRENKLLGDHPIIRGREPSEQISRIITFTGQSLKGPAGSVALLRLGDTAVDITRLAEGDSSEARIIDHLPDGTPLPPGVTVRASPGRRSGTSAAGRAQGLAFNLGKGRVVVLGEAAMLSAQVTRGPVAQFLGQQEIQMGMNRKGIDNRQLALNIVHWLSRWLN